MTDITDNCATVADIFARNFSQVFTVSLNNTSLTGPNHNVHLADFLSQPLSLLMAQSFSSDILPDDWKTGTVRLTIVQLA